MAAILVFFAGIVIGSVIVKALRSPPSGTGGPSQPPGREKPSADAPTPAQSGVTDKETAQRAERKTPPA